MNRRDFNKAAAAVSAAAAFSPLNVRAQAQKLKVGVLLPRSGFQGLIGQSCQKGADLAPGVIKQLLGVDIELMNADTETNVDTARTRAGIMLSSEPAAPCWAWLTSEFPGIKSANVSSSAEATPIPPHARLPRRRAC